MDSRLPLGGRQNRMKAPHARRTTLYVHCDMMTRGCKLMYVRVRLRSTSSVSRQWWPISTI
jgi:hypothetical protein